MDLVHKDRIKTDQTGLVLRGIDLRDQTKMDLVNKDQTKTDLVNKDQIQTDHVNKGIDNRGQTKMDHVHRDLILIMDQDQKGLVLKMETTHKKKDLEVSRSFF
jgi:hypothetical protein